MWYRAGYHDLRELCGGSYFAEPRGIDDMGGGIKKGYDTNAYTTPEIERIGRVGIELARKRDGRLTSVEKANVMHSGVLWRQVMTALHKVEGDGVQLSHMYADNCAMQLVRNPKQFDVIVTDNCLVTFYRIVRPCLPDRLACCHLHRLASQTRNWPTQGNV